MKHTINASLRNKQGKEVSARTPLVVCDRRNAREALAEAIEIVRPLLTPTVDSIVLHCIDAKGERTTATEYAEDITGPRGTSLGSSLLDQNADHGLSPAEVAKAQHALERRALEALPKVAEAFADKTIEDCKNRFNDGVSGSVLATDKSGDKKDNTPRSSRYHEECKWDLGRKTVTVPSGRQSGKTDGDEFRQRAASKMTATQQAIEDKHKLHEIWDEILLRANSMEEFHGHKAESVTLSPKAYEQVKKSIGMGPQAELTSMSGIKIQVGQPNGGLPYHLTFKRKPRGIQ